MSVTLVTNEVLLRQRTGFNYWNIPGCIDLSETIEDHTKIETLDECISRVLKVNDFNLPTRKREIVYAKHLKRYILERLTIDGKITDAPRVVGRTYPFRFSMYKIAQHCGCDHATVIHATKTTQNLIDTDKNYRDAAKRLLKKIELNLIKFPEL